MKLLLAVLHPVHQVNVWINILFRSTMITHHHLLLILLLFLFLLRFRSPKSTNVLPPSPPKLPIIGNLHQLGSLPHRSLRELSKKYGHLMLLHLGSVPTLVVSSAEMACEVMKTHDVVCASRPPSSMAKMLLYGCDMAFTPYGEYWRQVRKICVVHLLNTKMVQSSQSVREEEVSILVAKIRSAQLSSVNLSELLLMLSSNVVSRVALGGKYHQGEGGARKVSNKLSEFAALMGSFPISDFIPWLGWLDGLSGLNARARKYSKELENFLDGVLEEHLLQAKTTDSSNKRKQDRDLLDVLLSLDGKDESVGVSLKKDNIKALILITMASRGTRSRRGQDRDEIVDEVLVGQHADPVVGEGIGEVEFPTGGQTSAGVAADGTFPAEFMTFLRGMMGVQTQQAEQIHVQTEQMHMGFQSLLDRIQTPGTRVGGVRDFVALRPREFLGTESAIDAHEWFEHMEAVLAASAVPEYRMVDTVQIQFFGNARAWYDSELSRYGGSFRSWDEFRQSFYDKYFPKDAETDMIRQFSVLVQGTDSVDAYAAKFERLSKFAKHMMRDEEDRAIRFLHGLSGELQRYLASHPPDTLRGAVAAARRQERALEIDIVPHPAPPKRGHSAVSGAQGTQTRSVQSRGGARSGQTQASVSMDRCHKCGNRGHYARDCLKGTGRCYGCGAAGHIRSECPMERQQMVGGAGHGQVSVTASSGQREGPATSAAGRGFRAPLQEQQAAFRQTQGAGRGRGRGQAQGRVFAMTAEEVEEAGDVIAGCVAGDSVEPELPLFEDSADYPQ